MLCGRTQLVLFSRKAQNLHQSKNHLLSLSSKAFTYPRFGPDFLRTSSYAQLCPRRVHVEQLGFVPSHLSFLFLQMIQAILFGLGTVESPPLTWPAASFPSPGLRARLFRPGLPVGRERSLKYPSGGVFELVDMLLSLCYINGKGFRF